MTHTRGLLIGLLALALAAPALAQTEPQGSPAPAASGTVTGGHGWHGGMGMWNLVEGLDGITVAQRQQIEALRTQYQAAHQPGSTPDRATMRSLRTQLMQILTAAQQTQLKNELMQMRRQHQLQAPDASPSPR